VKSSSQIPRSHGSASDKKGAATRRVRTPIDEELSLGQVSGVSTSELRENSLVVGIGRKHGQYAGPKCLDQRADGACIIQVVGELLLLRLLRNIEH
jgi:hypothetical protein